MGRVFSTQNFDLIRVSQYLMNGLKGGCKGLEYSKTPKKPLSSSTGMTPETLIYHNACNHNLNHNLSWIVKSVMGSAKVSPKDLSFKGGDWWCVYTQFSF